MLIPLPTANVPAALLRVKLLRPARLSVTTLFGVAGPGWPTVMLPSTISAPLEPVTTKFAVVALVVLVGPSTRFPVAGCYSTR